MKLKQTTLSSLFCFQFLPLIRWRGYLCVSILHKALSWKKVWFTRFQTGIPLNIPYNVLIMADVLIFIHSNNQHASSELTSIQINCRIGGHLLTSLWPVCPSVKSAIYTYIYLNYIYILMQILKFTTGHYIYYIFNKYQKRINLGFLFRKR